MSAGLKHIGHTGAAFVDEHGCLPGAHHELGAVLDLVVVPLEAVNHRFLPVIEPFDDVD